MAISLQRYKDSYFQKFVPRSLFVQSQSLRADALSLACSLILDIPPSVNVSPGMKSLAIWLSARYAPFSFSQRGSNAAVAVVAAPSGIVLKTSIPALGVRSSLRYGFHRAKSSGGRVRLRLVMIAPGWCKQALKAMTLDTYVKSGGY